VSNSDLFKALMNVDIISGGKIMSGIPCYSVRQRLSVWILLLHYIFSLSLLSIPPSVRAQLLPEQQAPNYILYHKTAQKSSLQILQEIAPQIDNLDQYQLQLEQQYGLTLNDWLLLPDTGPQTLRYPAVKLVNVEKDEDIANVAFRYHISPSELRALNSRVKTPEQMKTLAGQWIVVPQEHNRRPSSEVIDEDRDRLRDVMASTWGNAQQNGAGNALRSTANSAVNAALTQEVESWLKHAGGKARVTADIGLAGNDSRDVGLDFLWPVKIWQDDILFTQMSAHRWNDRNMLNLGLGWRHTFTPYLLAGGSVFFDQDITRHHNRLGLGGELWSDKVRASVNYYLPLSGWRHSSDNVFNDDPARYELYERAARGWDANVETALSQHVSANVGWFQWYGEKVDVNGSRSEASRNPHGLDLGLNWQPVPLLGISAEQRFISGQRDDFSVGVNFRWEFGRKLSEMLASENASAMPSLMQSRTEFVTRNNNIVLAYKQKEKDWRLYFVPTQRSTPVGVPLLHAVKGGQGGTVRYTSSNPTIASVDEASGQVNPKRRGEVTITATETAPMDNDRVFSAASYQLSVTPGDFAPSVTGVTISGDMTPGNTLTASYTYVSNEGEDEDPTQTQLRWFDKASGKLLKEGSTTWQVSAEDMSKTLVFQVTPVNKAGVAGETGIAEISGGAAITTLRIEHLLSPGEIRSDGSVKFFAKNNGALLLMAQVKDGKGVALADQRVYWQSENVLGTLSQNSARTDAHGQALVKMTGIMAEGSDRVVASLVPPGAISRVAGGDDLPQQQTMTLNVDFSRALSVEYSRSPKQAEVATEQEFSINVTDQDGAPISVPMAVTWKSNGTTQSGMTDGQGQASITLTAPQKVANGWDVSVEVGEVRARAPAITLEAGAVSRINLDVPDSTVAGSSDVEVSAELFDRFDNPIVSRKQAIDWHITGSQFSETASGDSDAEGKVSAKVAVPKTAPASVEVSAGKASRTMQVVVGKVDSVELVSTPDTLNANGTNTATLTAIALDAHQNVVQNAKVVWSTQTPTLGTLSNQVNSTGPDGKATAILTTATQGGVAKVTAEIEGKSRQVGLTLNGIPVVTSVTLDRTKNLKIGETIRVANYQVEENGSGAVEMSWQWTRDGNLISGANGDGYTLTQADTGTQLAVLVWATNKAGNKGEKTSEKTDRVIGLVDRVFVTSDTSSVNADGSSTLTFTALVLDKNGVAVPDETISWAVDKPSMVTQKESDAHTSSEGKGKLVLVARHTGGDFRVTATVGGKSGNNNATLKGIPLIKHITLNKTSGLKVGDTLKVVKVDVEKNGGGDVKLSYSWQKKLDGVSGPISQGMPDNYTLKETDTGALISVYITATNTAKNSGSLESEKTQSVIGAVARVAVTASTKSIDADGSSSLQFTAKATDKRGVAVPNETISWDIDKPTLVVRGESDKTTDGNGEAVMSLSTTHSGGVIQVNAKVNGKQGSDSVLLKGSPIVNNVQLKKTTVGDSSATLFVEDYLTATAIVDQNGGGSVTMGYQWLRDGKAISPPSSANVYQLQSADLGKKISVTVIATNAAKKSGEQTSLPTAAVVSGVPTVTSAIISTSQPYWTGNRLTAKAQVNENGGGVPELSYQWKRGNSVIPRATFSYYTPGLADLGSQISVTITATNWRNKSASKISSPTPGISTGVPEVTSATLTKTAAVLVGDVIHVSAGVLHNGAINVNKTYQWKRDGVAIVGATSDSYILQNADIGKRVSAQVNATNEQDSSRKGSRESNVTDAVKSGIPEVTSASVVSSGELVVGQTATASWSIKENGGGLANATFQWKRDGIAITNATNAKYRLQTADIGRQMSVLVTATNAKYKSGSKESARTNRVESGVPDVTGVSISKTSNLRIGDNLTATATVAQNSGGAVTLSYQWKRDGVNISGTNSSGYRVQSADAGKQISVNITATNSASKQGSRESARTQAVVVPRMRIAQQSYYYFTNGWLKRVYEPHVSVVDENGNPLGGVEVCFAIKRDDWWDGDGGSTFRVKTGGDGKTPVHQIDAKLKAYVYFNAWICAGGRKPSSTVYMWKGGSWSNAPSDWTGWINR